MLIADGGGGDREAGSVTLRGHFFPVRGRHGTRGPWAYSGHRETAGGRTSVSTSPRAAGLLAAVRTGTVVERRFDPRLDGNFVVIRGLKEERKYRYSHLARPSPLQQGDLVHIGDIVGHIGRTGNAGTTPCHLHFERYRRGRPIDPES